MSNPNRPSSDFEWKNDVDTRLNDLALRLHRTTIPLVSVLPSDPYDLQEVDYQNADMAIKGVIWRFRWIAAAPFAERWHLVGGRGLYGNATAWQTGLTLSATIFTPFDFTTGPDLIVPLTGFYTLRWSGAFDISTAASDIRYNPFEDGVNLTGIPAWGEVEAGEALQLTSEYHGLFLTAGRTIDFRLQANVASVAFNARERSAELIPIVVSP